MSITDHGSDYRRLTLRRRLRSATYSDLHLVPSRRASSPWWRQDPCWEVRSSPVASWLLQPIPTGCPPSWPAWAPFQDNRHRQQMPRSMRFSSLPLVPLCIFPSGTLGSWRPSVVCQRISFFFLTMVGAIIFGFVNQSCSARTSRWSVFLLCLL